jgi:hypothetical protein
MALLTVQQPTAAGLAASYAAATGGGDTVANNGKMYLHIKNGSGGSITVTVAKTISTPQNVPGYGLVTISDISVAIAAGAEKFIGPIDPNAYNATAGTGLISITYSGVTSLTIAAIQF